MKYWLLSLTLLFCCNKNSVSPPLPPEEKWVEQIHKMDTLIFDPKLSSNDKQYFILNRGKEIRNGFLLPKVGAGIYEYHIHGNKIALYNTISNCYCFADYQYSLSGGNILIENFYDPGSKGIQETFEKIR